MPEVLLTMALVGVCAASSLTLAYSIAFQQLKRADGIGVTRVWGTVSWILLLWVTSAYMQSFPTLGEQLSHTPQTFQLAALLTALVAMNALTLPHTPPAQTPNPFAFIDALRLLRGPSFRSLIAAAALSSMCLQFHFMLWPLFFTDPKDGLGMTVAAASRASSLAQIPELLLFPVLGPLIARFGMRRVLIAGTLAWPLRFLAYAVGRPSALVVGMQVLHAVTVVCGVAVSQIAVDRIAKAGSRVSSQALLATATSGAGNLLGQIACGVALSAFARADGGYAWPAIFVLPLLLGALALLIVLVGFRPNPP